MRIAPRTCAVAALASAALQQPAPSRQFEDCLEEPVLRSMRQEARAELAQNGVAEADVSQFQAQQILPVDPCADRVGGLPVGQPFHEL